MELHEKFRNVILQQRNRTDFKLTQEDIAKEAGLTIRYYQKLEAGIAKRPSLDVVNRIAHAFDMKLSDLCKLMEEMD
ncbi:MAG: helix-turn-helix transcriptional regulator [Prevotella sp.]|jgi:transcriptional regulator with XRE-family HTH domain|nr:helix-turn-helix transcriptional regulator [Prevotella sp.]